MVGSLQALGQAAAAKFTVTVKNLTNGIYFTPLLITAHDGDTHLFETGSPVSPALQAMAEGGDISGLVAMVGALGIPIAPGDDGGTGASGVDANTSVHFHRGVVGDTDPDGGISDLDSSIHRWLNPVTEVVIEVHSRRHGRSH